MRRIEMFWFYLCIDTNFSPRSWWREVMLEVENHWQQGNQGNQRNQGNQGNQGNQREREKTKLKQPIWMTLDQASGQVWKAQIPFKSGFLLQQRRWQQQQSHIIDEPFSFSLSSCCWRADLCWGELTQGDGGLVGDIPWNPCSYQINQSPMPKALCNKSAMPKAIYCGSFPDTPWLNHHRCHYKALYHLMFPFSRALLQSSTCWTKDFIQAHQIPIKICTMCMYIVHS